MYPLRQRSGKRQIAPYLIVLPALLLFVIFHLGPSFATIGFSFTDMTRTSYKEIKFIGLDNYREFFRPATFRDKGIAIKNSIVFTVVVTLLQNGIALAVALVLNQKWRGRSFFRAAIFLPVLLGVTVNGLTWRLMFHPFDGPVQKIAQTVFHPTDYKLTYSSLRKLKAEGLPETTLKNLNNLKNKNFPRKQAFLNAVEQQIGAESTEKYNETIVRYAEAPVTLKFFNDPQMAFPLIIFVQIWQYMGWSCVIFLAGLQAIPAELYEAAKVDGAGKWSQFHHVTFPLIAQAVTVNILLAIIGALQTFDIIYVTTNGNFDTKTMAFYMFDQAFQQNAWGRGGRLGFASSVATLLFVFIFVVAVIAQKYLRRREVEL